MKICFFCYTPFHVFNAINIKSTLCAEDKADLYLYNASLSGTSCFMNRIINSNIFEEVFLINNISWNRYSKAKKLLFCHERLFRIDKKIKNAYRNYKRIMKSNCNYEIVWSFGAEMEAYCLWAVSLINNPKTHFYCYEEGLGAYLFPCTGYLNETEKTFLFSRVNTLLPKEPEKMLFYLPSCVSPDISAKVEEMPKISEERIRDLHSRIWGNLDDSIVFDVLIFAAGMFDQSITFEVYNGIKNHKNIKTVVKAHPRFISPFKNKEIDLLECGTIPWEVICERLGDIDSKLLIGNFSTSQVTPKSVFNKEPYLVFLNEMDIMTDTQRIGGDVAGFLQRFIQSYSDQSKIFFPHNMDELVECINCWYIRERL